MEQVQIMYFHNAHQLIKVTETICIKLYQELETINFGGIMKRLLKEMLSQKDMGDGMYMYFN